MLTEAEKLAIYREISGRRAQEIIARISLYHRTPGGREILQAMEYLRGAFVDAGLEEVDIQRHPVDGIHRYWEWDHDVITEAREAELDIIFPPEEQRVVARYADDPISLMRTSS